MIEQHCRCHRREQYDSAEKCQGGVGATVHQLLLRWKLHHGQFISVEDTTIRVDSEVERHEDSAISLRSDGLSYAATNQRMRGRVSLFDASSSLSEPAMAIITTDDFNLILVICRGICITEDAICACLYYTMRPVRPWKIIMRRSRSRLI